MTILTSVSGENKADLPPPPEIFNGYAFLVDNEKNDAVAAKSISGGQPVVVSVKSRQLVVRRQQRCLCFSLFGLFIILILILGSICLYKNLLSRRNKESPFICEVRYHESDSYYSDSMINDDEMGEFEETIEIDDDYEKIVVPVIGDTSRSTILHEFSVNYTAIIDKDKGNCFLMPLNRTLVLPPRDFRDLLMKLKTGYYIPDTYIVRESYSVVTPPVSLSELDDFGIYISIECRTYNTYKLVKNAQSNTISKRAACAVEGDKYCMGGGGKRFMLCFEINGCM